MPKSRTLPSRTRANVLRAYRSRGRLNRNLWLVYSLKTNRDWILGSDRHLVHWILFLETNPDVRSFDIEPTDALPTDGHDDRLNDIDAVVQLKDGRREYHKLIFNTSALDQKEQSAKTPDNSADSSARIFSETDFESRGDEAMRWLKVLCYCETIRDELQSDATVAAITIMRGLGRGTIGDVLESLRDFDPEIAKGIISRMAVLGDIDLDLSSSGFTLRSSWIWRSGK